jgi:HK97 family phage major capsid protein
LTEGTLLPPQLLPTIAPGAITPVTVAQLLARGMTDAAALRFIQETTFTNAAATVLEGGTKPESTLAFQEVDATLRKIATWLPATEEILEDVQSMRSYIDARLVQGVAVELDDQLLNGNGVAPNLLGILNTTGLAAAVPVGAGTAADAIATQIAAIYNTTGLMPDGVVLNPTDWLALQLVKATTGEYLGTGPFTAPVSPTLWGLAVAVTPAIAAGTGLVGAFGKAAQLFQKGGIRVEVSNSHSDYFIKNLVAIRAEVRAALAVYRPAAFGTVTGL